MSGKLVIPKDNPELPAFLSYVDITAKFHATFDVDALTGEGEGGVDEADGFAFGFSATVRRGLGRGARLTPA